MVFGVQGSNSEILWRKTVTESFVECPMRALASPRLDDLLADDASPGPPEGTIASWSFL